MNIKTKLHYPTFYRRIMRFANWSGTAILAFCFDLSLFGIKQYFFPKNCACSCTLCEDGLTALQRRNLVEIHVPFVSSF